MANEPRAIQCKHCETRYKISTSFFGRMFECKRCHHPVFVSSQTAARRPMTRRHTRRRGNTAPQKASPIQVASGIISAVLVIGIVVFLFTY